jgi:hypothetical protein
MFTQVAGKIRLALAPEEPQWAQVPLYPTARGLSTSAMPWQDGSLDIEFDLLAHELVIRTSPGAVVRIPLTDRSVARFYADVMSALEKLGVNVSIWPMPVEVADPIPFEQDDQHATYDPRAVEQFFDVLTRVARILHEYRAEFRGRTSPVQFFWGTFDLANTRFSGVPAPPPPDADVILRRAHDTEQIAVGFWPGDGRFEEAAFFAYAFPQPEEIERTTVTPPSAFWSAEQGLFLLRYDDARAEPDPGTAIRDFFDSSYTACAALMGWSPDLVERGRR